MLLLLNSAIIIPTKIYAVRPFITDDAAVVEHKSMQLETWFLFDKFSGQHWIMLSYGACKHLECAIGSVFGYNKSQTNSKDFSFATPLLEVKYLFCDYESNRPPGVALVLGTFLPSGKGEFVAPGYGAYSFLAATQCFGDDENVLIHGNIGGNYLYANNENQFIPILGLGTQIKAYKGLHIVGEIVAGDPYVPKSGIAYQAGFRYFINDNIQVDAEVGQGITGKHTMPLWIGFGIRFASLKFEKKKK